MDGKGTGRANTSEKGAGGKPHTLTPILYGRSKDGVVLVKDTRINTTEPEVHMQVNGGRRVFSKCFWNNWRPVQQQ